MSNKLFDLHSALKLCTYNDTPPEVRANMLCRCPLNIPRDQLAESGCVSLGQPFTWSPDGDEPRILRTCRFPRNGAGVLMDDKEKEKLFATNGTERTERKEIEPMTATAQAPETPMAAKLTAAIDHVHQANGTSPASGQPLPPASAAQANAPVPASALEPLWPRNMEIPFIGVTGEFGVGKTLFGLLIDPPRCVHFDFEQSAKTYQSGLPFTRFDMQDLAREHYKTSRFKSVDMFVLWRDKLLSLPKGRFRVAVIDDVSTPEAGLFDYVRTHPAEFGYTANQFQKSEALMLGAAKAHYKQLMLAAGIECCVMVAHMRNEYIGNRPTGRREAKGKETVMELASLYLMLDRRPDDKGKVPEKPNAVKLKDRLSVFVLDPKTGEYEPKPALPPRITGCTPARIRWYIDNPPNYEKLKKDELYIPNQMTDDERLMVQAQLASDQKEAAQAQAANQAAVNEAAKIRIEAMRLAPAARAADQSSTVNQAVEQRAEAVAVEAQRAVEAQQPANVGGQVQTQAEAPPFDAPLDSTDRPAVPMVTTEQLAAMKVYKDEKLQIPTDAWKQIVARRGVASAKEMTFRQADELLAALEEKFQKKSLAAGLNEWANQAVGQ